MLSGVLMCFKNQSRQPAQLPRTILQWYFRSKPHFPTATVIVGHSRLAFITQDILCGIAHFPYNVGNGFRVFSHLPQTVGIVHRCRGVLHGFVDIQLPFIPRYRRVITGCNIFLHTDLHKLVFKSTAGRSRMQ